MITTQDLTPAGGAAASAAPGLSPYAHTGQAPPRTPTPRTWPSARTVWIMRALCTIAFGISGYLGYTSITGDKVAGCGSGGLVDCGHVLTSRWSGWLTIPVSFPAMGLYAVCLGCLVFANSVHDRRREIAWQVLTCAGIAAGLAAIWFVSLQFMVIGHLCPWCLGAHTCGLILAGIILWQRPAGQTTTMLATLSVLGVGVLVGGQLAYEPEPVLEVEYFDPVEPDGSGALASPGEEGAGDGDDVFTPPGTGDDDVFAPPGTEDDVFAPPGVEDEDSGVFLPPGTSDEETEFESNGD